MVLAAFRGDFLYDLLLFLHILAVVVGFGSTFALPAIQASASRLDYKDRALVGQQVAPLEWKLIQPPIIVAGVLGILLIVVSDDTWKFSDTWISIAFVLFFAGLAISNTLMRSAQQRAGELIGRLAAGTADEHTKADLEDAEKKIAMFGGMLHLIFVLLLLDMVFKPGA